MTRNTNVTAFFSEDMDPTTLTTSTFKLYRWSAPKQQWIQVTDTAVSCDSSCRTATLDPYPSDSSILLAPHRKYLAVVTTGVKDVAGNALATNNSWNFTTGVGKTSFYNNTATGNTIGWNRSDMTRNDRWFPDCARCPANTSISGDITLATEQKESKNWQSKLSTNSVQIGPQTSAQTASPDATSISYSDPLQITQGGTYSGAWQSTDPSTPAVTVSTTEPVTIENCNIKSKGDLIKASVGHADITVKNCNGYAQNPDVASELNGRFLSADSIDNLVVENNYIEGVWRGIHLHRSDGNGSTDSIKIRYNKVKNIDGRRSDGAGGYRTGNTFDTDWETAQFLHFDKVRSVPDVEIAWNEVINEPYKSRSEDVIHIYDSAGTSTSPIRIHDNYLKGSYPADPANQSHSGGGIMLGDWSGTVGLEPAYVEVYDNQVVSTDNYGIAISGGHDLHYYDNKIVSSAELADGTKIYANNVGAYVWNANE